MSDPAFEGQEVGLLRDFSQHTFEGMLGRTFDFYGAANNQFKLDDVVMEAIEDPDDGFRSHLDTVLVQSEADQTIFFRTPIARVTVHHFQGPIPPDNKNHWSSVAVDFYRLIDVTDGHLWLEFGTDNTEDYYPSFTFRYTPKEPR